MDVYEKCGQKPMPSTYKYGGDGFPGPLVVRVTKCACPPVDPRSLWR